ncbi:MAG: CHAT domain-containing protein, partial [Phormidesmis sp.]
MLVLVSNPKGTSNLSLLPEIRDLQEALQRSQHRHNFCVEWRIAKTQKDLRHYVMDIRPHIIHFCGHGTAQGLVLEDDNGTAKVVANDVLTDFLQIFADRIECVLLNACYTESLAEQLSQHLNYVIGMNQAVYDDAAIAFAEGFYDAIGAGESYEWAF